MFGQVLLYGFVTGTEVLLVALGLYLVYLVSRVINLALGGIAAATAYIFYFTWILQGWPLAGAIAAALVAACILGLINFSLNESLTRKGQFLLALLTSFSLAAGLEALLAIFFGTGGKSLAAGVLPTLSLGAYQLSAPGAAILALGALIAVTFLFLYFFTPIGRKLRAISEQQFTAMSLGINQSKVRLGAYACAAVVAGAIGILVGFDTALTPIMGFNLIAMGFIAFLVGGVNDLRGTIISAYVVTVIPELIIGLTPSVSANWRLSLVFVVAAILLVLRPAGIFSKQQRLT